MFLTCQWWLWDLRPRASCLQGHQQQEPLKVPTTPSALFHAPKDKFLIKRATESSLIQHIYDLKPYFSCRLPANIGWGRPMFSRNAPSASLLASSCNHTIQYMLLQHINMSGHFQIFLFDSFKRISPVSHQPGHPLLLGPRLVPHGGKLWQLWKSDFFWQHGRNLLYMTSIFSVSFWIVQIVRMLSFNYANSKVFLLVFWPSEPVGVFEISKWYMCRRSDPESVMDIKNTMEVHGLKLCNIDRCAVRDKMY